MRDKNRQSNESSVKVFIRVRPVISIEDNYKTIVSVGADEKSVIIFIDEHNQIQTKFDKIISSYKTQRQMFANVRPYIDQILQGYNFTIFAYGQTGSGKTYTMFGKDWENSFAELQKSKKSIKQNTPLTDIGNDDNSAGLIPRSTYYLFSKLLTNSGGYCVYCSFLQIYNQKVYDLLQDSPIPNPLNIHQSKFQGIFVEGLGQFKVSQYTDCLQLIRRGEKNRFIRQTSMNAKSSRSHTIFQIILQSTRPNQNGAFTRARMNLCDLAGSQKINKTQNMKKDHLDQLKNINLSLTTLGKVINALSKGSNKSLAFFRQSKLTRLLQQSLVGNTNTVILGALSPSSKNRQETLNTLKFVERAKHIKLQIKATAVSAQSGQLVNHLQQQMQQLRKLLLEKEKNKVPKQVEQKLKLLEKENDILKNQTLNKKEDIYALAEQNRKMKQALNRMQRAAIQQLSNASFLLSEGESLRASRLPSRKSRMKQTERQDQRKSYLKFQTIPRYEQVQTPPKKDFLPPISSRLNKSVHVIPEDDVLQPVRYLDGKGRNNIINKFERIQQEKKRIQNQLINDYDPAQFKQSQRSYNIRAKSTNQKHPPRTHSTLEEDTLRVRPKKKQDFSDKIKQLEARLKKSRK